MTNGTGQPLSGVAYPVLDYEAQLGASVHNDAIVYPALEGLLLHKPAVFLMKNRRVAHQYPGRGSSQFLGRSMEWTSDVTEYEENSKMAQVVTSGSMNMQMAMLFEAVQGGTKFTMAAEGEFGGFFKLAEGMVNRKWRAQMDESLSNLKKMLEAAGSGPAERT